MMPTFRLPAAWGLAALLTACGASGQALSQADLQARIDTLATRGDTVALAKLAEGQCQGEAGDARSTCYETYFTNLSSKSRVKLALGSLAALAADRPEIELAAHGYAHVIGILSWKPGDDVVAAFKNCSVLFQSGCYHGVVQAYLTNNPVDSVTTNELCDRIAPGADERWLRFQCVHGLGHGLEMVNNWDLPKALNNCDWLASDWDRHSCYGGAFMENSVASMPGGHHTSATALAVSAGSGAGSMAGMKHDDSGMAAHGHSHAPDPSKSTFQMRDPKDPLYPCTAIAERYHQSCYQNQGAILLTAVGSDFAKATKACDRAPAGPARSECYLSLGTNASGMTARNTAKSIEYCSHGDPAYQPNCFIGVVKNYIDVTAEPQDGVKFCEQVPAGANRVHCYVAVGQQIGVLWPTDTEKKSAACARAGQGEKECRIGAVLPAK